VRENRRAVKSCLHMIKILDHKGDSGRRMAYCKAVRTLLVTKTAVTTPQAANSTPNIGGGAIGGFVVEASTGAVPRKLQELIDETNIQEDYFFYGDEEEATEDEEDDDDEHEEEKQDEDGHPDPSIGTHHPSPPQLPSSPVQEESPLSPAYAADFLC
jgi:hypothetical protein